MPGIGAPNRVQNALLGQLKRLTNGGNNARESEGCQGYAQAIGLPVGNQKYQGDNEHIDQAAKGATRCHAGHIVEALPVYTQGDEQQTRKGGRGRGDGGIKGLPRLQHLGKVVHIDSRAAA